jgi:hypothetical protein
MKKAIAATFLFLFIFSATAQFANAAGLVPCGQSINDPNTSWDDTESCKFCHIFVLFDTIYGFVLKMVGVIATVMFVIGGFYILIAGGRPEMLGKGKKILFAAVIGLVIIFGAWVIINTVFSAIGVSEWTNLKEGWHVINCN